MSVNIPFYQKLSSNQDICTNYGKDRMTHLLKLRICVEDGNKKTIYSLRVSPTNAYNIQDAHIPSHHVITKRERENFQQRLVIFITSRWLADYLVRENIHVCEKEGVININLNQSKAVYLLFLSS